MTTKSRSRYRSSLMLLSVITLFIDVDVITCTVPSILGMLSSLTSLQLDFNDITVKIPTELGMFLSSTVLGLHFNDITGVIPSELDILLALKHFEFDNMITVPMVLHQWNVAHCPRRVFGMKYLASALVAVTLLALLVMHVMSCNHYE